MVSQLNFLNRVEFGLGAVPGALADRSRPTHPRDLAEPDARALYLELVA